MTVMGPEDFRAFFDTVSPAIKVSGHNVQHCSPYWFEQMNFECAYFAIFSRSTQATTQRRWKLRSCRLYWTEEICPLQPLMIQSSCFGSKSACGHSWLAFLQTWWHLYLTSGRTGVVTAPRRCKNNRIVLEDTQCIFELAQTYFYLNLGSTCWTHWTRHSATAPKVRSTKESSSSSKVCGRDIFIVPAILFYSVSHSDTDCFETSAHSEFICL